ncbi:alpha/beta hydrolase [Frateuria aurantia]
MAAVTGLAWSAATLAAASASVEVPPGQVELKIPSHGAMLNGFMYTAAGSQAHPVLVLLHGFPGNERNLDLAQAARRAGWDTLYFDYRGSWGSGGRFSFAHALEDVDQVLAFIRSPPVRQRWHLDTSRIALLGHSMGGGLALLATERDPGIRCTAALAAWNFGAEARLWQRQPGSRQEQEAYFSQVTDPDAGPLRSTGGALRDELLQAPPEWDFVQNAQRLRGRPLLLVADTRTAADMATYTALLARLHALMADKVTALTYVDDHPFSAHREALQQQLLAWLASACGKPG